MNERPWMRRNLLSGAGAACALAAGLVAGLGLSGCAAGGAGSIRSETFGSGGAAAGARAPNGKNAEPIADTITLLTRSIHMAATGSRR